MTRVLQLGLFLVVALLSGGLLCQATLTGTAASKAAAVGGHIDNNRVASPALERGMDVPIYTDTHRDPPTEDPVAASYCGGCTAPARPPTLPRTRARAEDGAHPRGPAIQTVARDVRLPIGSART